MTGLAIKDVEFNGATLRAAQDTENIIWVGVAGVCQGLGLSEGQMKNERKKIQTGCKRTYGRERRRMI